MVRNKFFSAINIVGLSISMCVGLLMICMYTDILSYDQFNKNHSRIYRVNSKTKSPIGQNDMSFATTSLKSGRAIQENFSTPEEVAMFHKGFGGDFTSGEKTIPLKGLWGNESIFKVFSFRLISGNPATALKKPYSIILTETSAHKLFGSEDALNKIVTLDKEQYTVTGILEDVPLFSHVHFELLGSLSTIDVINKDKSHLAWGDVYGTWVYLLLPPKADLKNLKANLDKLSAKENAIVKNFRVELSLQALDDIMVGRDLSNSIGPTLGPSMIWIFISLAFVVILSACFNYTNLSIARSLRRTREVGIRKVIGAMKSHVVSQFMVEAVLISLCALLVALLLFLFLRPHFLSVDENLQRLLSLRLSPLIIGYFILFAITVGVMAGLLPALLFAKVNAIQVLKNLSATIGFKKLMLRKGLIVFQYCLSIVLITSTFIIYKQYRHYVTFDLGFSTENVLNIDLQHTNPDLLEKELNELPDVKGISRSIMITSLGNYWAAYVKYHTNPADSALIGYNTVNENFLPLHKHRLIAGRNFTPKADSTNETEVIVTESILKRFNIGERNPAKAVDETINVNGKELRIVGIIKDFVYVRPDDRGSSSEIMFCYSSKKANWLNVKIASPDILTTYNKIESVWRKIDPVHPLEAKFYSEQIEKTFSGLKASIKVGGFIAFLAIGIASLGLLGMVVFSTETRLKEISIRKVLGAGEAGLLYLLGRGFIALLIVAAVISLPITYLFFDQVLFQELGNYAPITISDFLIGVSLVLLLALATISLQTLKATRANPAEVLKSE